MGSSSLTTSLVWRLRFLILLDLNLSALLIHALQLLNHLVSSCTRFRRAEVGVARSILQTS